MIAQLKRLDTTLQAKYDTLATFLSEATVHPETIDKILGLGY